MISWVNSLDLLGAGAPGVAKTVAIIALVLLIALRHRVGLVRMIICGLIGVVTGLLGWFVVDIVWRPFPEGVGTTVWEAIAVMSASIALGVVPAPRPTRARWVGLLGAARAVCVVAVVLSMAVLVNLHFRAYTTLGDVLGTSVADVELDTSVRDGVVAHADGQTVSDVWTPPADLPEHGTLSFVDIPGTTSGFSARAAMVYLPPAYLSSARPALPVLILMAGQPGAPRDWQTGGHLQQTMDAWAQAHDGLAPIVVVPDPLGSAIANPLCSDTSHGKVATYLQVDVPAWVTSHLQVDPATSRWAVAGASNGATCSLQIITRSTVFRSFVAMSPEPAPSLGTEARTIANGFDGDADLYAANNPMDLMAANTHPGVAGRFVVGDTDPWYRDAAPQLEQAAAAAGMDVDLLVLDGGHSWQVWTQGLAAEMDWLGQRMELV